MYYIYTYSHYTYINTYIHTYIYARIIYTPTHAKGPLLPFLCEYTYINNYIHTYIRTYIHVLHIYIHTYSHAFSILPRSFIHNMCVTTSLLFKHSEGRRVIISHYKDGRLYHIISSYTICMLLQVCCSKHSEGRHALVSQYKDTRLYHIIKTRAYITL